MRTLSSTLARTIALSVVLLAAVGFVLQGVSALGHNHATAHDHADCVDVAAHAHDTLETGHAEHPQGHEAVDHEATDDPEPSMAGFDDDGSCCDRFCSSVMCVLSPSLATATGRPEPSAIMQSQVPEGTGPSGLKRPPRTIGMT